ncbi:MAG: (5-formylfuran-3-yl)methyl phosphate synthase, partial [Asgard group archaeon]
MKLLASVVNVEEAKAAIIGEAHIIDVKNPDEGSLGANFPQVIREISSLKMLFRNGFEVSAAVGDAPNLPGTISLACVGAATAGADYVKIGLFGVKNEKEAIYMM